MRKLEINHIVGYLPYGLKAEMLDYKRDYVNKQYDTIVGVHQWDSRNLYWSALTSGGSKPELNSIKPILRPLSDLIKEIEVGGKKFVPIEYFGEYSESLPDCQINDADYFTDTDTEEYLNDFIKDHSFHKLYFLPFGLIEKLYEWHFDIHDLISCGLAIDVNTLP